MVNYYHAGGKNIDIISTAESRYRPSTSSHKIAKVNSHKMLYDLEHKLSMSFKQPAPRIQAVLFHDLLLRSYLYHCVWSGITAHNLTPENRDNNYLPHPLTPTTCLRSTFKL